MLPESLENAFQMEFRINISKKIHPFVRNNY